MQSQPEKKFDEIKDGKYEYLIQGVVRTGTNGYELKLKTGHSYQRLRVLLLTSEKNHYVYKPLFNEKDVKEVVLGIGNPALTFVYESNPEKFELENFIGEGGVLFLGHKEANGNNYPKIECFIKPKGNIKPGICYEEKSFSRKEPANSYAKDAEHAKDPDDEELPF